MRFSLKTAALATLLTTTTSALPIDDTDAFPGLTGKAIVVNKCKMPVYLWPVGAAIGSKVMVPPNGNFIETYRVDPASGGMAIKVTTVDDGLFKANTAQTVFSYSLDKDKVWYDLSDVFGDGFSGKMVTLKPTTKSCPAIAWPVGTPVAPGTEVKECTAMTDVVLTLCA